METPILGAAVGLWAAVHSWLASNRVKATVRDRLGEGAARAYRLFYNAFSVISLAPILLWMRSLPDRTLYRVDTPWAYGMLAAQALCALLLLLALLQTGPLHFAGVSQLLPARTTGRLVTTGFYHVVRHPLYLFGLLILWLTPFMTVNLLTVSAVLTIYVFIGALLEERRLLQEFGTSYEEYRTQTPMIVPALKVRPPASGARMKKP